MVSMTGYWNVYKLDIPMQSRIAMMIAMMSWQRKLPSMLPSQDEAHGMIGDFNAITVFISDNELHFTITSSARLDGQMLDIPELEIWRMVSLWMLQLLLLLTSLLGISAQYRWDWHRFLPSPEICEVELKFPFVPHRAKSCTEWYWSVLGLMGPYVRICWMVFWSFPFLSYSCTCLCSPGGLHL